MMNSLAMLPSPSLEKVSLRNATPPGGTWMNTLRPIQKKMVASSISAPGTPNAQCGPKSGWLSSQGVSSVERKAPKLIAK